MLAQLFIIGTTILCIQSRMVQEVCDDSEVIACRKYPRLINYTYVAPSINDAADFYCPYKEVENYTRCVHYYSRRCVTTEEQKLLISLHGIPSFSICAEDSPYRYDYLNYANCLRINHDLLMDCFDIFKDQAHINSNRYIQKPNSAFKTEEFSTKTMKFQQEVFCRPTKDYMRCVSGFVQNQCGSKEAEFSRRFIYQGMAELWGYGCKNLQNEFNIGIQRISMK